jgi:uncharacterized protein with HEPN domain
MGDPQSNAHLPEDFIEDHPDLFWREMRNFYHKINRGFWVLVAY